MEYLTLNIETAPLKISDETVIDYQIRKRFKRDFHPAFARVVAVGLQLPKDDRPLTKCRSNEMELIGWAWDTIRKTSWDKLVTWNGIKFEVPFLKARSRILGIPPEESIDTSLPKSPGESNHIDCMWILQGESVEIPSISLEIAARLLGVEYDETRILSSIEITRSFDASRYDEIKECCSENVTIITRIFKKLLQTIEVQPRATKKQVDYILSIAKKLGLDFDRKEVESWTKQKASTWIDEHK